MTDTLLVRAADGGWEELLPQQSLPEGGLVDVLGSDLGPVLGLSSPVVVVAASPQLASGSPDAICVDTEGGVWILQSAFDGGHDVMMPTLIGCGGSLTGMGFEDFEAQCNVLPENTSLFDHVIAATGASGNADAFQNSVITTLESGQFHLVGLVHDAPAGLVQSLRFLQAAGARVQLLHTISFASASVTAIRATQVDLGGGAVGAPVAAPAAEQPRRAPAKAAVPRRAPAAAVEAEPKPVAEEAPDPVADDAPLDDRDRLLAPAHTASDEQTAGLIAQLHDAAVDLFDEVRFEEDGANVTMVAALTSDDASASVLTVDSDGGLVLSFSEIGVFDSDWSARAELSQGMERLLGTDLGDVKEIGQLNLSIREHLNDATLIEVLVELLGEMAQAVRHDASRAAAA